MTPQEAKEIALGGNAHRRLAKAVEDMEHVVAIATSHGNWDYAPYFHGMANGLLVAHSILTGKDPEFLSAPERWLEDSVPETSFDPVVEAQFMLDDADRPTLT